MQEGLLSENRYLNRNSITFIERQKGPILTIAILASEESQDEKKCIKYIEFRNVGPSIISYSWQKLPDRNPFELNRPSKQRFYFDHRPGAVLPDKTIRLPITFQTDEEGIFLESWSFNTVPKLLPEPWLIRATLRGLTMWHSNHPSKTWLKNPPSHQIESDATIAWMRRLLCDLVSNIQSPIRLVPKEDNLPVELVAFHRLNPNMHYHSNVLEELNVSYTSLFTNTKAKTAGSALFENQEETECSENIPKWDCSLSSIRKLLISSGLSISISLMISEIHLYPSWLIDSTRFKSLYSFYSKRYFSWSAKNFR
ncbi:unnamed protein product [Protopolystoma xenopodis]|uniref:Uncharacterized protein n=1 Tax=Protopolystoma xenopodis TaxID=117903 RepID=A0A448WAP1_9PLAT|nr:unnamed protein product [Protopolystoma xenopodis]